MRPFWLFLCVASLIFAGGGLDRLGGAAAEAASFNAKALDASVIRKTNAYRKSKGLGRLKVDSALTRAAQRYAGYYAANPGRPSLWGHEYGGLDPMDRAEKAGFGGRCVGENLGWQGTTGALASLHPVDQKMLSGWIKSRSHRKNLEYRHFDVIGVGSATFRADGRKWIVTVQMFGCSQPMPNETANLRFSAGDR